MTLTNHKNIGEKNGTEIRLEYIQWDLLLNESTIQQNLTNSSIAMERDYN
jgi:hypothetical protein